jgi:hypothetical protein
LLFGIESKELMLSREIFLQGIVGLSQSQMIINGRLTSGKELLRVLRRHQAKSLISE